MRSKKRLSERCRKDSRLHTAFPLNIQTPSYYTCSIIQTKSIFLPAEVSKKTAERVANSVDPDKRLSSVVSALSLHCLLRPVCRNRVIMHTITLGDMLRATTGNTAPSDVSPVKIQIGLHIYKVLSESLLLIFY